MANLREKMPTTAAWIDAMRAAFGAEHINAQIKKGIDGGQAFYAVENGVEVGTAFKHQGKWVTPCVAPKMVETKGKRSAVVNCALIWQQKSAQALIANG